MKTGRLVDTLRFMRPDALYWVQYWVQKFRMRVRYGFDEHFLRRCGTCSRRNGTGHKMDCHREFIRGR